MLLCDPRSAATWLWFALLKAPNQNFTANHWSSATIAADSPEQPAPVQQQKVLKDGPTDHRAKTMPPMKLSEIKRMKSQAAMDPEVEDPAIESGTKGSGMEMMTSSFGASSATMMRSTDSLSFPNSSKDLMRSTDSQRSASSASSVPKIAIWGVSSRDFHDDDRGTKTTEVQVTYAVSSQDTEEDGTGAHQAKPWGSVTTADANVE